MQASSRALSGAFAPACPPAGLAGHGARVQRPRSIAPATQILLWPAQDLLLARSPAAAQRAQRRRARCAALLPGGSAGGGPIVPDDLPEGLRIEPVTDGSQNDVEFDPSGNVVRIPLAAMDGGRRTKLVMFTCNKCGGRSARLVNPLAWEKGLVFAQCQHCEVWHTLAANNPALMEEIRYDDPEGQKRRRDELLRAALADDADSAASTGTAAGGLGGGGDDDTAASAPPARPQT
ncbi:hypothetical protein Rsub_06424 [Raphidocelis subcapitata]|uniref:DNL-type domain-containing protein n=1 Tax=Raphidocelis subcapitata TaxID=307507 RepID=A0A2V0P0J0_9CHLO|nr:hypothetical protein Rsub_06424 [Raphidocelis subcapitata]|eukprot:GBF93386.1 hypothetical protein Rsub_06424 [Raphidocelis subcapitata]